MPTSIRHINGVSRILGGMEGDASFPYVLSVIDLKSKFETK